MDDRAEIVCGYCGEVTEIDIDALGGASQTYVEDCAVCCRPNRVTVVVDPETLEVSVSSTYEG